METILSPTSVRYDGLYAEDGLIELNQLGASLRGLSKVGNSVTHFYLTGQLAFDQRLYRVKYFTGQPKEGCVIFDIAALMVNSQLPLFSPLVLHYADEFLPKIWKTALDILTGRNSEAEMAIGAMAEMAARHADFAQQVHEGHMADKKWLQDHVGKLSDNLRAPFRDAAAPVGRSCRKETVWPTQGQPTEIDEPTAQVLRSKEGLELGDLLSAVPVRIRGLNLDTGSGRAELIEEDGRYVSLRITDPALGSPGNLYSRALDSQEVLEVTAKPTLKDGQINSLFVSDARSANG